MKKALYLVLLLLVVAPIQAQIDRSQQPKPGPAPKIQLDKPQEFVLKNGLRVLVVENHKLPRASANLNIDVAPIFEGELAGVNTLLSSMLGKGSQSIEKDGFEEEVDFLGARLSFGSSTAFASSLSRYFPRVLELMADAALNPNFLQEEFDKEKEKLMEGIKSNENSVSTVARRVESLITYGKNHPYGEYISEASVSNIQLTDVKNYYSKNFNPENAYLVIIGDVDFATVKKQVTKLFKGWKGKAAEAVPFPAAKNAEKLEINFVDMPNAVQSKISVDLTTKVKKTDADYFPMLVANRILGGGGQARLFLNLREDKGYTYGSYSSFRTDKYSRSRFRAYASVRNAVTDSSVVELVKEINKIKELPVSQEELDQAKAKYVGDFVLALERPSTIAQFALSILTEGLPNNFYITYLQKINAVSIKDIQRVTQKYFHLNNARIFVTGKGSEVLENLEKVAPLGKALPIKFYDKYGVEMDRPDYDSVLPDGVDATSIINAYFDAIGGKDKAEAIQSKKEIASASMQGMTLEIESKKTNAQQSFLAVKMMGNVMQKQVINKTEGYMEAQGQRMPMDANALAKALPDTAVFAELILDPSQISLAGIVDVNGTKAYELKVSDSKSYFYSVESSLKIKISETQEMQGNTITQETMIGDYKAVDGILFPHTVTQSFGPQKIDFITSSIELNVSFSDKDFQ
ncbi:MAG: insulinase family protein [Flavobacteriaceae bacterium]|nr:insulinase family protein [Flavobacteriaceae bacterium]